MLATNYVMLFTRKENCTMEAANGKWKNGAVEDGVSTQTLYWSSIGSQDRRLAAGISSENCSQACVHCALGK